MMNSLKQIKKRDGRIVDFNRENIVNAIEKSFISVDGTVDDYAKAKANNIADFIEEKASNELLGVEDIQDLVENGLMNTRRKDVARAYITYRNERNAARGNTTDNDIEELIMGNSEYWNTENSNKDSKIVSVQRDYLAGIASTDFSRRRILPKDVTEAHDLGIIHEHDIDYLAQFALNNCGLINLDDMLQNGTVINGVMIEPQHRLITATTVSTQAITAVASSQYGGCSITLSHLAPFVRMSYNEHLERYRKRGLSEEQCKQFADEDTKKEIKDAVQTFNYQINSMSTTNGQAPFLSVFMYLNEDPEYIKETAMLIEEFLKQRIQGLKNEKGVYVTQAFPKLLYVTDDNNITEDSEYYYLTYLAAKCTAKRMIPDYISAKKMKELKGDVFPCMGCRSFLTKDRVKGNIANAKNYIEGKGKYYGRFNVGVTTVNLPDIAFSSGGDFDKFWELFEKRTELCHKGLRVRIDRLEKATSDVAPILWRDGAYTRLPKGTPLKEIIHGGYATASLGYAGLYECVKYMTGESHSDPKGMEFGLQVMQALNNKCNQWKEAEDIDYSPYGSPIESTTYKFAKNLKKRFGDDIFIKLDGFDRNYITNSYHIPVFEEIDIFDKLIIESKFQELSPGGAISYGESGNLTNNIDAVLEVIKFIHEHIMYAELNTKSDYCHECGYEGEILIDDDMNWYCPNCGNKDQNKMNVARRTCGYIGAHFWNYGRTNEIKDRYVHLQ